MSGADGRFAPSPTGDLHIGNLRTALLSWLFARAQGARFLVRIDDLDPDRLVPGMEARQLADLTAIGLDWDEPPVRQSERLDLYRAAVARLRGEGRLYRCFCTRAEIREAASAPNRPIAAQGMYPGTCADLSTAAADELALTREWCLRLRAEGAVRGFDDRVIGRVDGVVDDFVVQRKDGVPAYNLATVVDDGLQGIGEIVRGADLADSTPRQLYLADLLEIPVVRYAHVPIVLGPDGTRLAKRHGSVTIEDLGARGIDPAAVLRLIARSLGLAGSEEQVEPRELVSRLEVARIPRESTVFDADSGTFRD